MTPRPKQIPPFREVGGGVNGYSRLVGKRRTLPLELRSYSSSWGPRKSQGGREIF